MQSFIKWILKDNRWETYQIFLVPVGNTKLTEELELQGRKDSVTSNNKKEKPRYDLDDEEETKA